MRLSAINALPNYDEKLAIAVEQFLYRASGILSSLQNMYEAERQTVMLVRTYINQIKFGNDKKVAISAEPLFFVYAQIPACLTLLIAMQNDMLIILQKIIGIKGEVPSSLNKALKKGLKQYGFPENIDSAITEYWSNGGEYIRDVRDVNEHHLALVDQSYFKYESDPGQVIVCFPDNPQVKSRQKFTYIEEIDAYTAIAHSLKHINILIDGILEGLGVKEDQHKPSIAFGNIGELGTPQNRTLGLMINVQSREQTESGIKLVLDTVEMSQVIPTSEGGENVAVRKMKTDQELENEPKT